MFKLPHDLPICDAPSSLFSAGVCLLATPVSFFGSRLVKSAIKFFNNDQGEKEFKELARNKKYNYFSLKNTITIKITDQKHSIIPDSKAFYYHTNVVVNDNEVALNTLHVDNILKVDSKKRYEIIFEDSHLGVSRFFKLPAEMNENLFNYLTGGKRKGENCVDFINDIYFGCGKIKLNDITMDAPLIINDDKDLEVGQAIGIGNKYDANTGINIKHFAIYIGQGLFISPPGENPLVITTLEQIQLLYKSDGVAKISPCLPVMKPAYSLRIG